MNLIRHLQRVVETRRDQTAVCFLHRGEHEERALTYGALDVSARRLCARLQR